MSTTTPTITASSCTVSELKGSLLRSHTCGLALDIDETLAATNVAWFGRCIHLFGNRDGLTVEELIQKYHLAQYNPHWQNNPKAREWMHEQRQAPEAQDDLALIPGAVEGVTLLQQNQSFVCYLTVRPESVTTNTIRWLHTCGFPRDIPVVAKPNDIRFDDCNQWKAKALQELWPNVTGIVDDNPKVPQFLGADYPGQVYLFGKSQCEPSVANNIPCPTWDDGVHAIRNDRKTAPTTIAENSAN